MGLYTILHTVLCVAASSGLYAVITNKSVVTVRRQSVNPNNGFNSYGDHYAAPRCEIIENNQREVLS